MRSVHAVVLIAAAALCAGAGAYALRVALRADPDPASDVRPTPPVRDAAVGPAAERSGEAPVRFVGFFAWSPSRRLDLITRLQDDPDLPAAELAFLRAAITRRELLPVTRNNIANCLIGQRETDPELYRLFARMYDDADEDPVWRDYCVQFLGLVLPHAADPAAVQRKLEEAAAAGAGEIPGTASIHLVRNAQAGHVELADDFWPSLAARLDDPALPDGVKLTILGLLGRSGEGRHLPLLRRRLADPGGDELLRATIGSIGLLGGADDIARIEPYAEHADPAVAMAATAALERLRGDGKRR